MLGETEGREGWKQQPASARQPNSGASQGLQVSEMKCILPCYIKHFQIALYVTLLFIYDKNKLKRTVNVDDFS